MYTSSTFTAYFVIIPLTSIAAGTDHCSDMRVVLTAVPVTFCGGPLEAAIFKQVLKKHTYNMNRIFTCLICCEVKRSAVLSLSNSVDSCNFTCVVNKFFQASERVS